LRIALYREQEKVNETARKVQQSEDDFVEKNDRLRQLNADKYREVEDERKEIAICSDFYLKKFFPSNFTLIYSVF
jgi:hypothetical protein